MLLPDAQQSLILSVMAAYSHHLHRTALRKVNRFHPDSKQQAKVQILCWLDICPVWLLCHTAKPSSCHLHARHGYCWMDSAPDAKVPAPQAEPPLTVATSPIGWPNEVPCTILISIALDNNPGKDLRITKVERSSHNPLSAAPVSSGIQPMKSLICRTYWWNEDHPVVNKIRERGQHSDFLQEQALTHLQIRTSFKTQVDDAIISTSVCDGNAYISCTSL